ncbi:OBSCN [Mytilus coruscus]|uniref:OBSCN n=1 Tax=Mytilus coruscus TaxID=42192 RepID=A0A6J8EIQ6_MYTCO|nr:OBSCN [Mytilus coruscus]
MQTILIYFIVYQLGASHGDHIFHKVYAQVGSAVILSCQISKGASTQSWRKGLIVLTQGAEINRNVHSYGRLEVVIDEKFYNLKIYNISEYDFDTYWCEMQKDNSIRAEGTTLINLDRHTISTLRDSSPSETKDSTGIHLGESFYYGISATGIGVICLSIGCIYFINKCRKTTAKRKERSSDDNEDKVHALNGNGTNNAIIKGSSSENMIMHQHTMKPLTLNAE